ncbi:MAG: hypothetical protein A3G35_20000 [candidate division NC10 bacterium RIFCSPLOWO2_12_FULL_66_18]|nr:MAG: hypothetical protein A3G35_20000 [candidate division NC10 bacterium RIFCSPLOWO2_12_FULL_66_18]
MKTFQTLSHVRISLHGAWKPSFNDSQRTQWEDCFRSFWSSQMASVLCHMGSSIWIPIIQQKPWK